MDWLQILTTVGAGCGTVLLAMFKYYHSKLAKLEERMTLLIKAAQVHELLRDHMDLTKEKIEDKYDPIRERLDRLEDKIDALIRRKDNV